MAIMVTKKPPAYLREARVKAGYVSRGTASIAVPYSPETIGRHERGEVDLTPADAVVYAESYKILRLRLPVSLLGKISTNCRLKLRAKAVP